MIYRSSRQQQQDYRYSPAISQSQLKLLLVNVDLFNAKKDSEEDEYGEKEHFIIGNGVDTLITMGEDTFNEEYHISDVEKPSDIHLEIIKQLYYYHSNYEQIESFHSSTTTSWLAENEKFLNWQPRWNWQTKLDKFYIPVNQQYWEDLVQAQGKQILSKDQHTLIQTIVTNLQNSITQKYLNFNSFSNQEIQFQLPIYFIYQDVQCKALLDEIIIDHKEKTIQAIDIKTIGDYTINFFNSIIQRRYDFQAAFYTQAIHYYIQNERQELKDYKVLPFKFLVESTIAPNKPLIFTCHEELLLKRGKYGIPTVKTASGHVHKAIHGFHYAILLYKWYLQNGFEYDKAIIDSDGDLLIGLEGIIPKCT